MFEEVNEDEVVFDGVTYVSREKKVYSCDDCALNDCALNYDDRHQCLSVKCDPTERKDGRNVIFVEKQP